MSSGTERPASSPRPALPQIPHQRVADLAFARDKQALAKIATEMLLGPEFDDLRKELQRYRDNVLVAWACNSPGSEIKLTDRELVVLELLADGATNRKIASELNISVGSVKDTLRRISGKLLGVEDPGKLNGSRVRIAVQAIRLGLIK